MLEGTGLIRFAEEFLCYEEKSIGQTRLSDSARISVASSSPPEQEAGDCFGFFFDRIDVVNAGSRQKASPWATRTAEKMGTAPVCAPRGAREPVRRAERVEACVQTPPVV